MTDQLIEFYEEFFQDVLSRSDAAGTFMEDAFFDVFSEYLIDAGEIETADRAHYQGARGVRVDGYGGDPRDAAGVLVLLVVDFRPGDKLGTLTATDLSAINNRTRNFIKKSRDDSFRESLEEATPYYGLADMISGTWTQLSKIRIILMSNRVLSSRVDGVPATDIDGVPVTHNVWDLGRLHRYLLIGREREDIEIDLVGEFDGAVPALPATLKGADYEAYLMVIPGEQLAAIYDRWSTRLLEQNVRVFLQARGGVNKAIRVTLDNSPDMFFAYNNGISATAESVETADLHGQLLVLRIRNLQIVNGGQTTASIHAAKLRKVDLSRVLVQVKLSIIRPDRANEMVPKISQFANSQNRVSPADFFSNHPFHVRMESFSRRVFAPSPDGSFKQTKWFYERARGQYLDARSQLSSRRRKEFDEEYPRRQLFTKTDLGKFIMVWEGAPDAVSKGAQKNFAAFADRVASEWEKDDSQFSETYYKHSVARAIVFRRLESIIMKQEWYDGGYRANVVAYAIAKVAHELAKKELRFDFDRVWQSQDLSAEMERAFAVVAENVHTVLINPAAGRRNVTEWAKQQACWHRVQELQVTWPDGLEVLTVTAEAHRTAIRDGAQVQQIDAGIAAQTQVIGAGPDFWTEVRQWGLSSRLLSAKEAGILLACAAMLRKLPSELQCQSAIRILGRLQEEGLQLELG